MTTSTTTTESEAFLAAVKEQLSDLPEEERTDLLEDLAQHLADITADRAEDGPPLTTLLGEPEHYAAELRAAADLPPRTAPVVTKESFVARLGRSWPVRVSQKLWRKPYVTPVREFVPQLRPAWWVLRGYLIIALPALAAPNSSDDFPVPAVGGSNFLGFLFVVGAIVASVWLGRHPGPKWRRRLTIAGNAFLVIFALGLISEMDYRMSGSPQFATSSGAAQYQLSSRHGPVTNIFPYSADGTPLDNVLLYDQDGRPLRTEMQLWWPDRCERAVAVPRAADGVGVEFSYPKDYVVTGNNGDLACKAEGYAPQVPLPTFGPNPAPDSTIVSPDGSAATPAAPSPEALTAIPEVTAPAAPTP
ncbi:MAG TPA: hypothetical protein VHI31_06070 [Actinomycetota bacterium]|nr:hypothetical protein [Actinomycetota bacterium]